MFFGNVSLQSSLPELSPTGEIFSFARSKLGNSPRESMSSLRNSLVLLGTGLLGTLVVVWKRFV